SHSCFWLVYDLPTKVCDLLFSGACLRLESLCDLVFCRCGGVSLAAATRNTLRRFSRPRNPEDAVLGHFHPEIQPIYQQNP
ncbi:hypothetical protein, partial [Rothia nasimurium]|uniref:hypothetical protein n=1 Tax=Rothia nasimurium TaxID=85336 RepID=UPI003BA0B3DD